MLFIPSLLLSSFAIFSFDSAQAEQNPLSFKVLTGKATDIQNFGEVRKFKPAGAAEPKKVLKNSTFIVDIVAIANRPTIKNIRFNFSIGVDKDEVIFPPLEKIHNGHNVASANIGFTANPIPVYITMKDNAFKNQADLTQLLLRIPFTSTNALILDGKVDVGIDKCAAFNKDIEFMCTPFPDGADLAPKAKLVDFTTSSVSYGYDIEEEVPAPFPVLGVLSFFKFARKIKSRLRTSNI